MSIFVLLDQFYLNEEYHHYILFNGLYYSGGPTAMNRAKILTIFTSDAKEIYNRSAGSLAQRQTCNSLGRIATELPPSVCLGRCCWTCRALMWGLTGCPDVDAAPSTARRWRHYGWLKAKWGSILPLLPLAGGDTTAGIKAKWGSMQTDCPEIAGGRWQFGARGSVASALSSSSFEFVGVVRPFAASLKSAGFGAAGFGAAGFEFVRRLHGRVRRGRFRPGRVRRGPSRQGFDVGACPLPAELTFGFGRWKSWRWRFMELSYFESAFFWSRGFCDSLRGPYMRSS